jgi:hypothetical protein
MTLPAILRRGPPDFPCNKGVFMSVTDLGRQEMPSGVIG